MSTETTVDLTADFIDVRDIIARVEFLERFEDTILERDALSDGESEELDALRAILDDLKGYGGDEQWRGDWYPVTLIADSYFEQYAEELAEDVTDYDSRTVRWPFTCIDWGQAADELKQDYTSAEIEGRDYWYR